MTLRYLLPLLPVSLFATDYCFINKEQPWHIHSDYRQITTTKFTRHSHGHQQYADSTTSAYYSYFIDDNNQLVPRIGYTYLKFDWEKNPRFTDKDFHMAIGSLAYVSTSLDKWRWIFQAGASVNANNFDFGNSGVYHGLFWGRFHASDRLGVHIGMYGFGGMRNGYALPILGLDWNYEKWRLTAIFPIDLSLSYCFNQSWSTTLAYSGFGGPYSYPWRADHGKRDYHDPIFEVYSSGVDLNLKYHYTPNLFASIGGGYNFGGWILIKNGHNHHGKYFKYDPAPYGQARIALTF